jgi:hypothetical protein
MYIQDKSNNLHDIMQLLTDFYLFITIFLLVINAVRGIFAYFDLFFGI